MESSTRGRCKGAWLEAVWAGVADRLSWRQEIMGRACGRHVGGRWEMRGQGVKDMDECGLKQGGREWQAGHPGGLKKHMGGGGGGNVGLQVSGRWEAER